MFSLQGKVALVTGAGSGIGKQLLETLAEQGATVVGADLRDAEKVLDVTDRQAVEAVVAEVATEQGRLDIVVNSAGVVRLAPAVDLSETDWDLTLDVNLKGTFLVAQAAARVMREHGTGRIINIASQAASVGLTDHAAYTASKAGVNGLTRTLALEWGPAGITVNTVSPTVVLTPLGRQAWDNPAGEKHRAEIPTGRFAEPEEVAAAVCYLASDEAAMVNGAELRIDGGFTIR